MKTVMIWTAQRPEELARSSKRSLRGFSDRTRLRRLKNTLLPKGAWQQVTRFEDLCHTQVSYKWLYHLDACAGSVLPMCKKDSATDSVWVVGSVDAAVPS